MLIKLTAVVVQYRNCVFFFNAYTSKQINILKYIEFFCFVLLWGCIGDQSWVFFGRNDAKAETLVLWPLHAKSSLIGKDSDAGRDWGQEEKGTTEDEMAGCHHRLDAHEFE